MSFNDDQIDHMRSLAKIPPNERCYCAWYRLGECPHCPPGMTLADRLKIQCPDPRCQNYPPALNPALGITHNVACQASKNPSATKGE